MCYPPANQSFDERRKLRHGTIEAGTDFNIEEISIAMSNLFLYIFTVLIWDSTWLAIKFQIGPVDPMLSVS